MKTGLRYELRGRLDSLNAQIILLQSHSSNEEYIADLEEVRGVVNELQKCEARSQSFTGKMILWGLDEDEIHTRSHNPDKFYELGHILPHREMKHEAAEINFLRTLVREVELVAYKIFAPEDSFMIAHVLNRLSSALYILTYKYLPAGYNRMINFHERQ